MAVVFEVLDGAYQTIAIYSNRAAAEKHMTAEDEKAGGDVYAIAETEVRDEYKPDVFPGDVMEVRVEGGPDA